VKKTMADHENDKILKVTVDSNLPDLTALLDLAQKQSIELQATLAKINEFKLKVEIESD
jgi:hypothetical protein